MGKVLAALELERSDIFGGLAAAGAGYMFFLYALARDNNLIFSCRYLLGPVMLGLNYLVHWNNVFPQDLCGAGNYRAFLSVLLPLTAVWFVYWAGMAAVMISSLRRKRIALFFVWLCLLAGINCFSEVFQRAFIGLRVIM